MDRSALKLLVTALLLLAAGDPACAQETQPQAADPTITTTIDAAESDGDLPKRVTLVKLQRVRLGTLQPALGLRLPLRLLPATPRTTTARSS